VHRASYDGLAPRYADTNAAMPAAVEAAAEKFVKLLRPGGKVLDLGCGHGRDAASLAARGVVVTAVDLSAGMLVQAVERFDGPVSQGDMRRLPVRSAAFDGVWSNAAMLHLAKRDLRGTLTEVHRVLKDRGVAFVSFQVGEGEAWEPVSYGVSLRRFFARYSVGEFARGVESVGLSVLGMEESEGGPLRHWAHVYARKE